jgi:hypothetical protein
MVRSRAKHGVSNHVAATSFETPRFAWLLRMEAGKGSGGVRAALSPLYMRITIALPLVSRPQWIIG